MPRRVIPLLAAMVGVAAIVSLAGVLRVTASERNDRDHDHDHDDSIVRIGLAISPVHLNLRHKNRELVGKGSYLVNAVAGCNDCHTWRPTSIPPNFGTNYEDGGDPFSGQPEMIYTEGFLGGGRPFGPFSSRNITPDASGQVADGYASFRNIIRHGVDPDGLTPLLQVMPWPVYRNMSDDDLRAIYEYLTSIPCVEGTPGEPVNDTHRCGP
jgi:hypothetical protein